MASIPLRSGYAYRRWKQGIDVELPKKANSRKTTDLRTIVLFEADANFGNKSVAKKVAERIEAYGGFAPEQYGSRRNHRAIDCALNKVLTMDILRQLKRTAVLCSNDLKSCYDRIAHIIASLSLQKHGVNPSEVVCMFTMVEELEHVIKTAYGTSDDTLKRPLWAVPMQGVYQGNGNGPVVWAVISSELLNIMRDEGFGTFFKSVISGDEIRLVGYAFVDDTDLIHTAKDGNNDPDEILSEAQDALTYWEGLIRATGGALSLKKSAYWLIHFKWKDSGGWEYATTDDVPGELQARDFDNQVRPLKRKEVTESFETLGVGFRPDGNQQAAFDLLKSKATKWADHVRVATFRNEEAGIALKRTVLKTLEYPLAALHLSPKQCDKLMSIILCAALPKAGYVKSFGRAQLYAPNSHFGGEFHTIRTTQLISHVETIVRQGPSASPTGQLLRASIENAKIEIGDGRSLFQRPYKEVHNLLTDSWIKSCWKEFEDHNVTVHEGTLNHQLQREDDKFLMIAFQQAGYDAATLRRLNRCRIFHRALLLSDVVTGNGRTLIAAVMDNNDRRQVMDGNVEWPYQGMLPDRDWATWRKALKKITNADASLRIFQPLGKWITPTPPQWACRITQRLERPMFGKMVFGKCFDIESNG